MITRQCNRARCPTAHAVGVLRALSAALAAVAPGRPLSAQCQPEWSSVGGGANVSIEALAVHDEDGDGPRQPALFLASGKGTFAGQEFYLVARWDGWEASRTGETYIEHPEGVESLMDLPEPLGSIPRGLYAGTGGFKDGVSTIGRWDGQGWNGVGEQGWGDMGVYCRATLVFDEDGGGPLPPCLFAGGRFMKAGGGVPVNALARWDGQTWSDVGGGLSEEGQFPEGTVYSLAIFDDGRGPALYVGGSFKYADGKLVWNIARWDGQTWEPLGTGLSATVETLCVYDEDADGPKKPALFAGGQFNKAIDQPGNLWGIARWVGQAWTEVGGWKSSGAALCMTVWKGPDDQRENLYMGGYFNVLPTGKAIKGIARWDGGAWRELDYGISGYGQGTSVMAMAAFDEDGGGPNPGGLYVGGLFYYAGTKGVESHFIARWGCPLGPRCDADLDRDGQLSLFDFLDFVNLFNAEDPLADFDGSGDLTLFDFLAFTNAFNKGC